MSELRCYGCGRGGGEGMPLTRRAAGNTARTLGLAEDLACVCGSAYAPGTAAVESVVEVHEGPDRDGRHQFSWCWVERSRRIRGTVFLGILADFLAKDRPRVQYENGLPYAAR